MCAHKVGDTHRRATRQAGGAHVVCPAYLRWWCEYFVVCAQRLVRLKPLNDGGGYRVLLNNNNIVIFARDDRSQS